MLKPYEWTYVLSFEGYSHYAGSYTIFSDGEVAYTREMAAPRWIESPDEAIGDSVVIFDDYESMSNQTNGNQQDAT